MCEVCKSEGVDFKFKNGSKATLYKNALYKVFKDSVAEIKLCHVHSIELFMLGESRFIREHLIFARDIARRSTKKEESYSPFGF